MNLLPTLQNFAQRYITSLSVKNFVDTNGQTVRLNPSSPSTFESALCAALAMSDMQTILWLRDELKELMVSTATPKGLLPMHASERGVSRRGAQKASGFIVVSSQQDLVIPTGTVLTVDGSVLFETTADISVLAYVPNFGPISAQVAGISGNLAPNTELTLVNPIAGISEIISDGAGFTGGTDIEDVESWRARIIEKERRYYGGGTVMDYEDWAADWGASFCKAVSGYWGAGTVGVIFAMNGGVAPTDSQVQSLTDFMNDGRRPVRGNMRCYPAKIMPQVIQVMLDPDTNATRSAVVAALQPMILSVGIGGTLYAAALTSALFNITGVKSKLISPTSDIAFNVDEMPVLDHVEFEVPSA